MDFTGKAGVKDHLLLDQKHEYVEAEGVCARKAAVMTDAFWSMLRQDAKQSNLLKNFSALAAKPPLNLYLNRWGRRREYNAVADAPPCRTKGTNLSAARLNVAKAAENINVNTQQRLNLFSDKLLRNFNSSGAFH